MKIKYLWEIKIIGLYFYLLTCSNVFSACIEEHLLRLKQIEGLNSSTQDIVQKLAANFKMHAKEFLGLLDHRPPLSVSDLEKKILELQQVYDSIDRSKTNQHVVYENEFTLRFVNARLLASLNKMKEANKISNGDYASLLNKARIYTPESEAMDLLPQKPLDFDGVNATSIKFSDWADDPAFYNYKFEGDEIVFRGMRIRSGDLLLNHPKSKPTGVFTSLASEENSFSHSAVVVFMERNGKKLPVVMEAHEMGVRAVPLSTYLGPKVLGYAEVFRLKDDNLMKEKRTKLASEAEEYLKKDIPYDVSGSNNPDSMSCVEFVNNLYGSSGITPFPISKGISDKAYKNTLKLGDVQRDFATPTQVALSPRVKEVGYIDNVVPLNEMIANEAVLRVFRKSMTEGKIDPLPIEDSSGVGKMAIDEMRDPDSLIGNAILLATGFDRKTFPHGSKELLTSVDYIFNVTHQAMDECTDEDSECGKKIIEFTNKAMEEKVFSIREAARNKDVSDSVSGEMSDWTKLFKVPLI